MATGNLILNKSLATVLSLSSLPDERGGVCTVWYKGQPHKDLVTFDLEGWKLIYDSMGGAININTDAILLNMRFALNQLLQQWDFDQNGRLRFDKALAERWLNLGKS
jgi:hypothetical protein